MLDLTPVFTKTATVEQLVGHLTIAELRSLTNESVDTALSMLADCNDADVSFVPDDPQASEGPGWTIGHIIAHATASSEEGAFLAAELARGVPEHGRSRYETPWESLTTIAQCRARLQESRRMRLASLEIWPDQPNMENRVEMSWLGESLNANGRFALGLGHESGHLKQLETAVMQALASRSRA